MLHFLVAVFIRMAKQRRARPSARRACSGCVMIPLVNDDIRSIISEAILSKREMEMGANHGANHKTSSNRYGRSTPFPGRMTKTAVLVGCNYPGTNAALLGEMRVLSCEMSLPASLISL